MERVSSALKTGLLAGAAAALLPAPALADTLIYNVDGLTIDEKGNVERFASLVIDDDGTVRDILLRGEKRPTDIDFSVDGEGRVMMPGFIDAHLHVMGIGFAALTLDLSQTESLEEALAAIAEFAEANPGRPWILGGGWNQEKWGLGRFPTAAELDAIVPDRPVYLTRVDGHAGWANSLAMQAAGVDASAVSPAGGRIERLAGSETPSGIFVDAAESLVTRAIPAPRAVERDLALSKAQEVLFAQGVTAAADMGTSIEDWQTFRRAGDRGALKLRIMSYASSLETMQLIAGPGPTPWLYEDRLRMGGIKIYLDGALGSRGAWLKEDYADEPGNRGIPILTPAQLRNTMSRAAMDGFQTAVHAIGDAANAEVLAAIEELSETYEGDRRWRIEHAQIVDPADIPKLAEHGIIASYQPLHQTSDRVMAEARMGLGRLGGAYAWRSVLNAGGRITFGSDAPVEPADTPAGIAVAISRTDANGEPFGGWLPQETVSRAQAIAGFSSDAAFAGFAEGRFGRLVPGERADFVLVDRDPMLSSPAEIRNMTVLETWIGGERVYKRAE
ncbi:amidohydrolase family protein [Altererythrobacter sp. JGD-16]|uniref:Amidohydrolase family protein n=2 Tax=Altererythrobacter lutimaris TaxID=2743979 RepID=A0A850HDC9_9SPHN|nr:amidohydrolase [Altererythrobacter lutimaris]NVE94728.1 amidohydrolase family protein [Altererythrobacter lutimaris]